ncbi:MAG: hypothetical protein M1360_01965 [Candidatus Marsarchaeota archaeon]|jgi:hypothetical protein|nr:hypothetical protein [Candidatus Marsarchaeota archaeon]MCL5418687.1 hypothetical protein [Candidatus Marsarchaeota archaeon]
MITGFSILSVEGKIDSVDSLAKQKFPRLNTTFESVSSEGTKLKVNYSFVADYAGSDDKNAKSIGHLKLAGEVEVEESKEVINDVLKRWNEKHMLPVSLAEEIINGLNFRCSATGTLVAYSLGLIPPLVVSSVKIQDQTEQK